MLKERDESLKYVSLSNKCKVVCKKGGHLGDWGKLLPCTTPKHMYASGF